jgi:hypothetical protein
MHNYQVRPFSQYVVRTPTFPVSTYLNLVNDYSQALLTGFKILFLEAIRIASPELLTALDKWKENPASLSIKKKML